MFSTYAMSIGGMLFAALSAKTLFWYVNHLDDTFKDIDSPASRPAKHAA